MRVKSFLIFSICLLFFSEFSYLGRVGMEFGTKSFFSLSWPLSTRLDINNAGIMFSNFLNFFWNFLVRVV